MSTDMILSMLEIDTTAVLGIGNLKIGNYRGFCRIRMHVAPHAHDAGYLSSLQVSKGSKDEENVCLAIGAA